MKKNGFKHNFKLSIPGHIRGQQDWIRVRKSDRILALKLKKILALALIGITLASLLNLQSVNGITQLDKSRVRYTFKYQTNSTEIESDLLDLTNLTYNINEYPAIDDGLLEVSSYIANVSRVQSPVFTQTNENFSRVEEPDYENDTKIGLTDNLTIIDNGDFLMKLYGEMNTTGIELNASSINLDSGTISNGDITKTETNDNQWLELDSSVDTSNHWYYNDLPVYDIDPADTTTIEYDDMDIVSEDLNTLGLQSYAGGIGLDHTFTCQPGGFDGSLTYTFAFTGLGTTGDGSPNRRLHFGHIFWVWDDPPTGIWDDDPLPYYLEIRANNWDLMNDPIENPTGDYVFDLIHRYDFTFPDMLTIPNLNPHYVNLDVDSLYTAFAGLFGYMTVIQIQIGWSSPTAGSLSPVLRTQLADLWIEEQSESIESEIELDNTNTIYGDESNFSIEINTNMDGVISYFDSSDTYQTLDTISAGTNAIFYYYDIPINKDNPKLYIDFWEEVDTDYVFGATEWNYIEYYVNFDIINMTSFIFPLEASLNITYDTIGVVYNESIDLYPIDIVFDQRANFTFIMQGSSIQFVNWNKESDLHIYEQILNVTFKNPFKYSLNEPDQNITYYGIYSANTIKTPSQLELKMNGLEVIDAGRREGITYFNDFQESIEFESQSEAYAFVVIEATLSKELPLEKVTKTFLKHDFRLQSDHVLELDRVEILGVENISHLYVLGTDYGSMSDVSTNLKIHPASTVTVSIIVGEPVYLPLQPVYQELGSGTANIRFVGEFNPIYLEDKTRFDSFTFDLPNSFQAENASLDFSDIQYLEYYESQSLPAPVYEQENQVFIDESLSMMNYTKQENHTGYLNETEVGTNFPVFWDEDFEDSQWDNTNFLLNPPGISTYSETNQGYLNAEDDTFTYNEPDLWNWDHQILSPDTIISGDTISQDGDQAGTVDGNGVFIPSVNNRPWLVAGEEANHTFDQSVNVNPTPQTSTHEWFTIWLNNHNNQTQYPQMIFQLGTGDQSNPLNWLAQIKIQENPDPPGIIQEPKDYQLQVLGQTSWNYNGHGWRSGWNELRILLNANANPGLPGTSTPGFMRIWLNNIELTSGMSAIHTRWIGNMHVEWFKIWSPSTNLCDIEFDGPLISWGTSQRFDNETSWTPLDWVYAWNCTGLGTILYQYGFHLWESAVGNSFLLDPSTQTQLIINVDKTGNNCYFNVTIDEVTTEYLITQDDQFVITFQGEILYFSFYVWESELTLDVEVIQNYYPDPTYVHAITEIQNIPSQDHLKSLFLEFETLNVQNTAYLWISSGIVDLAYSLAPYTSYSMNLTYEVLNNGDLLSDMDYSSITFTFGVFGNQSILTIDNILLYDKDLDFDVLGDFQMSFERPQTNQPTDFWINASDRNLDQVVIEILDIAYPMVFDGFNWTYTHYFVTNHFNTTVYCNITDTLGNKFSHVLNFTVGFPPALSVSYQNPLFVYENNTFNVNVFQIYRPIQQVIWENNITNEVKILGTSEGFYTFNFSMNDSEYYSVNVTVEDIDGVNQTVSVDNLFAKKLPIDLEVTVISQLYQNQTLNFSVNTSWVCDHESILRGPSEQVIDGNFTQTVDSETYSLEIPEQAPVGIYSLNVSIHLNDSFLDASKKYFLEILPIYHEVDPIAVNLAVNGTPVDVLGNVFFELANPTQTLVFDITSLDNTTFDLTIEVNGSWIFDYVYDGSIQIYREFVPTPIFSEFNSNFLNISNVINDTEIDLYIDSIQHNFEFDDTNNALTLDYLRNFQITDAFQILVKSQLQGEYFKQITNEVSLFDSWIEYEAIFTAPANYDHWYIDLSNYTVDYVDVDYQTNIIIPGNDSNIYYFQQSALFDDFFILKARIVPNFDISVNQRFNNGTYANITMRILTEIRAKNVTIFEDLTTLDIFASNWIIEDYNDVEVIQADNKILSFRIPDINLDLRLNLTGESDIPFVDFAYLAIEGFQYIDLSSSVLYEAYLDIDRYSRVFKVNTSELGKEFVFDGVHYLDRAYPIQDDGVFFVEGWGSGISSAYVRFESRPFNSIVQERISDTMIKVTVNSSLPVLSANFILDIPQETRRIILQNQSVESAKIDDARYLILGLDVNEGITVFYFQIKIVNAMENTLYILPIIAIAVIAIVIYYYRKDPKKFKEFFRIRTNQNRRNNP